MSLTDNEQKILDRAIARVEKNKATEEEMLIFRLIQEHMLDEVWKREVEEIHQPYAINGLKVFLNLKQSILDCVNFLTIYARSDRALNIISNFTDIILIDFADKISCNNAFRSRHNNKPVNMAVDTFLMLCEMLDPDKVYSVADFQCILEDELGTSWNTREVKSWLLGFTRANLLFRVGKGMYQVNPFCLYDGGEINIPGYKYVKRHELNIYKPNSVKQSEISEEPKGISGNQLEELLEKTEDKSKETEKTSSSVEADNNMSKNNMIEEASDGYIEESL